MQPLATAEFTVHTTNTVPYQWGPVGFVVPTGTKVVDVVNHNLQIIYPALVEFIFNGFVMLWSIFKIGIRLGVLIE